MQTKTCEGCGKEFGPYLNSKGQRTGHPLAKRRFCSKNCAKTDPIGTVRIRDDFPGKARSKFRAWVKVAPGEWRKRAVIVWEKTHGKVLKNRENVHHIDGDSLNDAPNNLEAIPASEHITRHKPVLARWARVRASRT